MYAHITDQTITATGPAPSAARRIDTGQWVTPPVGGWTDVLLAACGWLPVVETPRPADTDTTTHGYSVQLVDGVPTVVWTPRDWTAEELASRAEQEARLDDHEARLQRIEAVLWPADPEPDGQTLAPVWADYGGVWPNGKLLDDGGVVWRNVSGVPLTTPPSGFPGMASQWRHMFVVALAPEPEPPAPDRPAGYIGPWDATTTYTVGDVCDRAGRYYRAKITHGAEYGGTWGPGPVTTNIWDDIGPVT